MLFTDPKPYADSSKIKILLLVDSNWFNRYEGRSKKDIFEAELFVKKKKNSN